MHRAIRTFIATCAALATVVAATAAVAHPRATNRNDVGLYGASDPTYDGVFRQSIALLGEASAGVYDKAAVMWLVRQQCRDGGWAAYRAHPTKPCPKTDANKGQGEDTNSTALAAAALTALGVKPRYAVRHFLRRLQRADGGFPYFAGEQTDPNSTGLVLSALLAMDAQPTSKAWRKHGHTAFDALRKFQVGCAHPGNGVGGFRSPYSSGRADALATVQATPAEAGHGYPVPALRKSARRVRPDCSHGHLSGSHRTRAAYAANWLAGQIGTTGYLSSGSGADPALTAEAVLSMVATKTQSAAIRRATRYLARHEKSLDRDEHGRLSPGVLGWFAMVASATGRSPRHFGGVDLIKRIQSTRRVAR